MSLIIELAGSICLLLWGSYTVRQGVDKAFSSRIGAFLSRTAGTRTGALICGILSATAFQSATAAIMLGAGFVTSGLLPMGVAIVVFLGADIGSAVAVRVLFLDLSLLPPLLLICGLLLDRFSKSWRHRQLSRIIIGIGLMLLSIQLIKLAVEPVIETPISESLLSVLQSTTIVALFLGALITWLVHSSVATVLVIASMAQIGFLPPELAAVLVLGANIGSGLIALLLVDRNHLETHCAVFSNFALRTGLALLGFLAIDSWLPLLSGYDVDAGLLVINLHLAFNILLGLLFAPFGNIIVALAKRILTMNHVDAIDLSTRIPGADLDYDIVSKPNLALSCARREVIRLADDTESMFASALKMFEADDRSAVEGLVRFDEQINTRNKAIQHYLAEARRHLPGEKDVENAQERAINDIQEFSSTMENIGDIVSHDLARQAIKRMDRDVSFSADGYGEITRLHEEVMGALQLLVSEFVSRENALRKRIDKQIAAAQQLGHESITRHRRRVSDRRASSVSTSTIHQDVVRDLMQVLGLISSIHQR